MLAVNERVNNDSERRHDLVECMVLIARIDTLELAKIFFSPNDLTAMFKILFIGNNKVSTTPITNKNNRQTRNNRHKKNRKSN